MRIEDLPDTPPGVLAALPAVVLMQLQSQADTHAKDAARMQAVLHGELARRYATGLNATGTVHREDGDVAVTVSIPKRVDWDQSKVADAVRELVSWGEDPAHYVETEHKVSERKYDAWPPAIRDLFTPARTVKAGKPTIKLAPAEAREAA